MKGKFAIPLVVALLFVPFAGKAFHIDDYFFLESGRLFGWNPLQAFPADYYYQGRLLPAMSPYQSTHPLLIPYLLKVLQALFGRTEAALHLVFLVFPALALWGLAGLARSLSFNARQLPLLLVLFGSLPAFVVNGQNLMTDVPTLAFLLAGAALCLRSLEEGGPALTWWGCAALTCAVFCSYQALAYLPVLFLAVQRSDGVASRRRLAYLAVLVPVLLMVLWVVLVYACYGSVPGLKGSDIGGELARGLQWSVLYDKWLFNLGMIGASLLCVLPLRLAAVERSKERLVWLGGLLAAAVVLGLLMPAGVGGGVRIAAALLCASGLTGLALAARELLSWRGGGAGVAPFWFCCGWLAVSLLLAFVVLPFGSARYLLPAFPILLLLLLGRERPAAPGGARLTVVLVCCSLLWGGLNAWADYAHAGAYREMAGEVAGFRGGLAQGQTVWYIGEWGMRHYFERAGARYLPAESLEPKGGDYVVVADTARFWAPAQALQGRLEPFAQREIRPALPLRLFNRHSEAGFYAHYWGMLPFAVSAEPVETFTILKVN